MMWFDSSEDKQLVYLQQHLMQLFNTRKGSISYLPDYGLPDLNEIYQQLPLSMGELVSEIKALIEKYEPRLSNVQMVPYMSDEVDCVVYLRLQGTFNPGGTKIHFETYFLSGGEAKINIGENG
jgi:type VI secretion system protein